MSAAAPTYAQLLAKTTVCKFWKRKGKCKNSGDCTFAHGDKQQRPCFAWATVGRCKKGTNCNFLHADIESAPQLAPSTVLAATASRSQETPVPPVPAVHQARSVTGDDLMSAPKDRSGASSVPQYGWIQQLHQGNDQASAPSDSDTEPRVKPRWADIDDSDENDDETHMTPAVRIVIEDDVMSAPKDRHGASSVPQFGWIHMPCVQFFEQLHQANAEGSALSSSSSDEFIKPRWADIEDSDEDDDGAHMRAVVSSASKLKHVRKAARWSAIDDSEDEA